MLNAQADKTVPSNAAFQNLSSGYLYLQIRDTPDLGMGLAAQGCIALATLMLHGSVLITGHKVRTAHTQVGRTEATQWQLLQRSLTRVLYSICCRISLSSLRE